RSGPTQYLPAFPTRRSSDLAMHLVQIHGLGVPQESRDAFVLLVEAGLLDEPLGDSLMRMVGFRNVAIHEYQQLNLEIVRSIIDKRLVDLGRFAALALETRGFRA